MRLELQPAFILHTRPYRDTSLLIDFFTPDHGRISAVARGMRQRKSPTRSLLNPFTRLLISVQGKPELKLLTAVEADNRFFSLQKEYLYSGLYLNELLLRSLPLADPHKHLFAIYEQSLDALQAGQLLEPVLRSFELDLLNELGYGVDFEHDALTGAAIGAEQDYIFEPEQGFIALEEQQSGTRLVLAGQTVLAIAQRDFSSAIVRAGSKQLCRQLLKPLLGHRPLRSRELFIQTRGSIIPDDTPPSLPQ
jgi:DNA repair protein RecO (recombination protein O)